MNTHDPSDIAPLSYGAGLALGLMLIIGLPAEKKRASASTTTPTRERTDSRLAQANTSIQSPSIPAIGR
jgi:hypothetical protein